MTNFKFVADTTKYQPVNALALARAAKLAYAREAAPKT